MKKTLILTIALLAMSSSLFAALISSGVLDVPATNADSPMPTHFFVQAEASESAQGLLLKYGTSDTNAQLVNGTIKKSNSENWDVFGVESTNNFYFFGTGRAADVKNVTITPTVGPFKTGSFTTDVQPVVSGLSSENVWNIAIPAVNPVGTGTYTGSTFKVSWDGTSSANLTGANLAPAGD